MSILTQRNPAFNKLELVQKGSVTVTKNANSTIGLGTFSHNLGYVPQLLAYNADQQAPLPVIIVGQSGADAGLISVLVSVNAIGVDDIVFSVITPDNGDNYAMALEYTIDFYLFRERAN